MDFLDQEANVETGIKATFLERITSLDLKKEIEKLSTKIVGNRKNIRKLVNSLYFNYLSYAEDKNNHCSSTVLLTGKTGGGKTFIIKNVLQQLDIPHIKVSAASLSASGYEGQSIPKIFLSAHKKFPELSDIAVIHIDEIDKLSDNTANGQINRLGVQDEILNMLDATTYQVKAEKDGQNQRIDLNTKHNFFIFSGSFSRVETNQDGSVIGFNDSENIQNEKGKTDSEITRESLKGNGFTEEMLGRIDLIIAIKKLEKKEQLLKLLEKDNTVIDKYQRILEKRGVNLIVEKSYRERIAERSLSFGFRTVTHLIKKDLSDIFVVLEEQGNELEEVRLTKEGVKLK